VQHCCDTLVPHLILFTQDVFRRAHPIRLAVFDVDGVLTDGGLHYTDNGVETKVFDVRDGHGMKMLQESGVELAIITSRSSQCVARRAENLGIKHLFQGVGDKLATFRELIATCAVEPTDCAYMGDDWIDLPVLMRCGLALSVPEAPPEVREHVHYVTTAGGGRGAVREVCELIMRAQGTFDARLAAFIK
jgi:3-deoxy-D-manno-octulosonate 8-phosphate phosphatase (KDO 8-P phosphatase)